MSYRTPLLGASLGHPSRRRDTAEACREKVKDNLLLAVTVASGRQRELLERSAAAWSMRADQLQRQENRATLETPQFDSEARHLDLRG